MLIGSVLDPGIGIRKFTVMCIVTSLQFDATLADPLPAVFVDSRLCNAVAKDGRADAALIDVLVSFARLDPFSRRVITCMLAIMLSRLEGDGAL